MTGIWARSKNNLKVLGDSLVSLCVQNILSEREVKEMQKKILKKNNIKISKTKKIFAKPEPKLINFTIKRAIETLRLIEKINETGVH
jgi:hypothetical protein|tara:strand:+ start:492 stop:752 length:261 start_codon:yes stop_codon:yes gene_type:complete